MTVDQMRTWVSSAYDGDKWKYRVRFMPDNQVIALYYKFLRQGKFNKPSKKVIEPTYRQMTIFDYI